MNIEHIALNVSDSRAFCDWYVKHLGMRIVRAVEEPPWTRFMADELGRTVLEIYQNEKIAVPDYFAMDPMTLHIAFISKDVAGDHDRLVNAGGKPAIAQYTTPTGDEMAFLRDPWGVTIQLIKRGKPLI